LSTLLSCWTLDIPIERMVIVWAGGICTYDLDLSTCVAYTGVDQSSVAAMRTNERNTQERYEDYGENHQRFWGKQFLKHVESPYMNC
jgi:hypothetical protein